MYRKAAVINKKSCHIYHLHYLSIVRNYAISPLEAIFISLTVLHHIRDIKDPEYPNYTLEQLQVVTEVSVEIDDKHSHVRVTFSPTVGNCKMAPAIGLCLQVKLMRSLPSCYKVDIRVVPGTLDNEATASLENPGRRQLIERCLAPTYELERKRL
ncbi:hypothetical protein MKX03_021255 [Papaver bracteatum]|nr:hypothetical protein MKX03_021255 [Papaver bracteatum]